jgi:murein DD-endopeptidase MepM/ murein hydrolase activator NlpD
VATATRASSSSTRPAYSGPFASLINAAARSNGLDPWLLAGLLKRESGFRPAPAHVDPHDAGIAGINLPSHPTVTRAQAEDPAFAIPWAARYLAELKTRAGGSTTAALRAYNTGSSAPSTRGNAYADAVIGERRGLLASAGGAILATAANARNAVGRLLAFPLGAAPKYGAGPYVGTHRDFGNWQSDNAVDLLVPAGTPVYALASGVIGPQIGPLGSSSPQLAGQRVYVNTPTDSFYYAHLSKLAVKAGEKVDAGQLIGYSGSANGVDHLHLAARTGNPLAIVQALDASGVKPGRGAVDASGSAQLIGLWSKVGGAVGGVTGAAGDVAGAVGGAVTGAAGDVAGALAGPFKDAVAPFVDIGRAATRFVDDPAYPFLWLGAMVLGVALIFVGVERLLGRSAAADAKSAGAAAGTAATVVAAPEAAPLAMAAV